MKELVRLFLLAWHESITHQKDLVTKLADTLGLEPTEMFYHWNILSRFQIGEKMQRSGILQGAPWHYSFHGATNCDFRHTEDGRFIQINFGSHGRYDVFSGWSTLLYIMASKKPWSEFSQLKEYLAKEPPPYTYLSGNHNKMVGLTKLIEKLGVFEPVDQELYALKCELKNKYTQIDEHGRQIYSPPYPYNNLRTRMVLDLDVSEALVLSEQGRQLFAHGLDAKMFSLVWDEFIK